MIKLLSLVPKNLPKVEPLEVAEGPKLAPVKGFVHAPVNLGGLPSGLMDKPANCAMCKFAPRGAGFCPDDSPEGKNMMFLLPTPTKGEISDQVGWAGPQGWIYGQELLKPVGLWRKDIMITHVLRCRPPWDFRIGADGYPTAGARRAAEMSCRTYDGQHGDGVGGLAPGGLLAFRPNMFVVSFEPQKAMEVMALKTLIRASLARAKKFKDLGFRVCVLFGEPALSLVAPDLADTGGIKAWNGHYFEADWKYRSDLVQIGAKRLKGI